MPIGILGAFWIFAVFGALGRWWTLRASDLLLGPLGWSIHAGPKHRVRKLWGEDDAGEGRVQPGVDDGGEAVANLWIADGIAAQSTQSEETRSLEAVAGTLRELHAQAAGKHAPRHERDPDGVIHCRNCGGPAAPSEAARVLCRYCGQEVAIPASAHEQLRALESLDASRAESERLLRRLLRQPGATATNALVLLALPPLISGWPLASIVFDEFFQTRRLFDWTHGVALFAGATSFTWGLSWLVRAFVGGRAAVRIIASRFAAVPSIVPGAPCRCRECGAPLPESPSDRLVVLCAYCRCENLTGVNLVPVAGREEAQAGALASELRIRLRELQRYRRLAAGSLILLVASVGILAPAWMRLRAG